MTRDLQSALIQYAEELHGRAANLLSAEWAKAWADTPTIRQRQYGSAIEALETSRRLVAMCGLDPDSVWSTVEANVPALPTEELTNITLQP